MEVGKSEVWRTYKDSATTSHCPSISAMPYRIMLLQAILIVSVILSSARTIENDDDLFLDLINATSHTDGHREKRQLFGFNTDFNQVLNRAISNLQLIRNTFDAGRFLSSGLSNVINATMETSSQPRTLQSALSLITRGARDAFFQYFRRMGLIQ
ncbi:uncharacterized protein TNIN_234581 [Trichonephila inaurata madagascariensis]|uniref:Uncharacterized protein n=1 Tax=Trichonephila inaurata madagascariensis TaxID=2747483 RepID=A0A8X6XGN0_9ARAC|nr:uncharacterized protein TNIN_234581 [Trichonephila inaurata madagascariensis]